MRGLKKATVWWTGLIVIVALTLASILQKQTQTAQTGMYAVIWIVGLGLGAQVLDSTQKSIWFRRELYEPEKKEECGTD